MAAASLRAAGVMQTKHTARANPPGPPGSAAAVTPAAEMEVGAGGGDVCALSTSPSPPPFHALLVLQCTSRESHSSISPARSRTVTAVPPP
eukprot:CAMPEP_0181393402 /NCGR_PEP_ID=MMETSP1106-20121128/27168_1 /TAXON_ID=81844 /ORGANISM="Mantoniella antarctica, Strain SL-175" /LENGTH=90 /DNA_ID=CAMNT_0023514715 /DNA_START=340 /DNA_END=609 /DNA_ORIENTATION=-